MIKPWEMAVSQGFLDVCDYGEISQVDVNWCNFRMNWCQNWCQKIWICEWKQCSLRNELSDETNIMHCPQLCGQFFCAVVI